MNIILWIVVGFIVGIIVQKADPGDVRGGMLATTLLGIAGAIIGSSLYLFLVHVPVNVLSLQGFLAALIGAFILAFIHRIFFRGKNSIKTSRAQLR